MKSHTKPNMRPMGQKAKVVKTEKLFIHGRKPIEELLENNSKIIRRMYVIDSVKQSSFEKVRELAKKAGIILNSISDQQMVGMVGRDANHQGVVAELQRFPYTDFETWLGQLDITKNPSVMLLDEVQDPHNVGAIIRTAAAAGFAGILIPEHRQAPVTGTVFKTSAGAVMRMPIMRIGNVTQTLQLLKDAGFWIYGVVQDGTTPLFDYIHDSPAVFVVGNEGAGVRDLTIKNCDATIAIPMRGDVESLNVATSAALVMYEVVRKSQK